MDSFVEVALPGGGSLIVEHVDDEAVVEASRGRRVADFLEESFESALDRVARAAETARERALALGTPPDEITVEFAINLAAAIGVVVANSTAEANMKLVFRWSGANESE